MLCDVIAINFIIYSQGVTFEPASLWMGR